MEDAAIVCMFLGLLLVAAGRILRGQAEPCPHCLGRRTMLVRELPSRWWCFRCQRFFGSLSE